MKLNKILALVLVALLLLLSSATPLIPGLPRIARAPTNLLNIPGELIGPIYEEVFALPVNHVWCNQFFTAATGVLACMLTQRNFGLALVCKQIRCEVLRYVRICIRVRHDLSVPRDLVGIDLALALMARIYLLDLDRTPFDLTDTLAQLLSALPGLRELRVEGIIDVGIDVKNGPKMLRKGKTSFSVDWQQAEGIESVLSRHARRALQISHSTIVSRCRLVKSKSRLPYMNLDAPGGPAPYIGVGLHSDLNAHHVSNVTDRCCIRSAITCQMGLPSDTGSIELWTERARRR
jgi:hypothetical protein